ncbi:hypothetical protein VSS92_28625, partial [Pseudomonas syringae pv. tagetis]
KDCWLMFSFHNPLGESMTLENQVRMYELLEQLLIPLFEDYVYAELYYGATPPPTVKILDRLRVGIEFS